MWKSVEDKSELIGILNCKFYGYNKYVASTMHFELDHPQDHMPT
jgi:hypothetical protein